MMSISLMRHASACLLALTCLVGTANTQAQQQPTPAALAAAKELLEIKGAQNMLGPIVPGVVETAKNSLMQSNPNLVKELNEVAQQLRTELAPRSSEVIQNFVVLYAQRFTEPELKQIVAFYRSPLGKKLLTDEPTLMDDGFKQAQSWADRFSEQVVARFREEMKKRGHQI
jgi:uncharacterized protein